MCATTLQSQILYLRFIGIFKNNLLLIGRLKIKLINQNVKYQTFENY